MWGDGFYPYCGDHFTIYTNIESLCCTSEANTMLYINYISEKNNISYVCQDIVKVWEALI